MDGSAPIQSSSNTDLELDHSAPVQNTTGEAKSPEPQNPAENMLSGFKELHLGEGQISPDTTLTNPVGCAETPSVTEPQMEFDAQNTPRDPAIDGSRNSCSSEENGNDETNEWVFSKISLDTLPVEVLLLICEYLEASVIINSMSRVCHAFHDLFVNEVYWRMRLTKRWPKKYPPVDCKSILQVLLL